LNEREKYHFILITSETDYFREFEEKYYKEKISEQDKKNMLFGLQTRVSKILDPNRIKELKKDQSSKCSIDNKNKLIEFDNTRRLIRNFVKKNYPYISFIYGGFRKIHDYSLKLKIPLLNHEEKLCFICKNSKRRPESKKSIFSKIFNWKTSMLF